MMKRFRKLVKKEHLNWRFLLEMKNWLALLASKASLRYRVTRSEFERNQKNEVQMLFRKSLEKLAKNEFLQVPEQHLKLYFIKKHVFADYHWCKKCSVFACREGQELNEKTFVSCYNPSKKANLLKIGAKLENFYKRSTS